MTVLVTGATGLVGNNVVRHLVAAEPGTTIRCLVRQGYDARPLEGLPVEIATGDVTDTQAVEAAFDGVSAVVHAAAMVSIGWSGAERMQSVNVGGTSVVAKAAREARARMVHVSTIDVLRGENCMDIPYVSTKRQAEDMVRKEIVAGLDAIIVRPAFVLGPYDWKPSSGQVLLATANNWIPFSPRGCLSLCDARDVATAVASALQSGKSGDSFELAGHEMSWFEAFRLFARLGNRWPPISRFDPLTHRLIGRAGDLIGRFSSGEPSVNSAAMRLAGDCMTVDDRKAGSELGYANRPLDETLADTWRWFRNNGYPR